MTETVKTAKEKMEALLAGKEVWQDNLGFRLSEDGEMQVSSEDCIGWENTDGGGLSMTQNAVACMPSAKYTFCQAIGLMAQGKTMRPVGSRDKYIIHPEMGLVSHSYGCGPDGTWSEPPLFAEETEGMWVEADE